MKTIYFDCFAGASGDMILGALVSAGVDGRELKGQLALLGVTGYEIDFVTVNRSGISAIHARVKTETEHKHRHLNDILKIINGSDLKSSIKDRAAQIFTRLAEAEAHVHNEPIEKVHFHEVGALDAIIDVVGAAICLELSGTQQFISSPLRVGKGTVRMSHGQFPIPPPAVAELLKDVPIYAGDLEGEFVTPTGAAIITSICSQFGAMPPFITERTGYGAGTREYENFPNALRVFIGEAAPHAAESDEYLLMIETNIDDMSPQIFGYVMERALALGALDCYVSPVQMKKNRPGNLLSILCRPDDREKFSQLLFAETTTLGIRSYEVERRALARESIRVETPYGPIDIKVARLNGAVTNVMPEYEQCRRAALDAKVALRTVEMAARSAFAGRQEQDE